MSFRVLVEPGSYPLHNHGDNAMMQVGVGRVRELWPDAEIGVVTSRPDKLPDYCPSAVSIPESTRRAWLSGRSLFGGMHERIPASVACHLGHLERQLWLRYPGVIGTGVELKEKLLGRATPSPSRFYDYLFGVDLLVICGMGLINDAFEDSAHAMLDEVESALLRGVQVVAMGQGIGPISTPGLRARASRVLPKLALIALRERRAGLPLLLSLGVPSERIVVTGDDAIELAYDRRRSTLGEMIGINLRIASYSEMGSETMARLRDPLYRAAEELNSALIPVPISLSDATSDIRAIGEFLRNQSNNPEKTLESTQDIIDTIGECRVVVTGSYHSGVFALAQGIPVVALVQSAYYEQKFLGLKDQFGCGCAVINLQKPGSSDDLKETICSVWESAERLRLPLLKAAAEQVRLSREAYSTVHRLCSLEKPSGSLDSR
jgi:polysaccharide pyruvyl transferase WcaK-like protein